MDINPSYLEVKNHPLLGKYIDIILHHRNANWLPVMMEQMKAAPTLFEVGMAHLGGEKGLISLLRRKGYTVSPFCK